MDINTIKNLFIIFLLLDLIISKGRINNGQIFIRLERANKEPLKNGFLLKEKRLRMTNKITRMSFCPTIVVTKIIYGLKK